MVRIFITSNPISTILMAAYAKRTKPEGSRDFLCIDHYFKKKALIELIHESAATHKWDTILDFSFHIENNFDLKPSPREKIMRKVKHLPLIKNLYAGLLNRHLKKKAEHLAQKIKSKLAESGITIATNEEVEIYQLTQTELNAGAEFLFPFAKVYYMEHGTVDYIYVIKKQRKNGYICIFKDKYDDYLAKRNISFPVYQCLNKEEFTAGFLRAAPNLNIGLDKIKNASSKRLGIFLMDALEKFNPEPNFWTDYIDHSLKEIKNPKDYIILIKPHPSQSNEIMEITRAHFKKRNIDFIMLDKPEHSNLSVETIYVYYQKEIDFVFSTFSAAIFYLAFFYGNQSKFFYCYRFVGGYIKNAPLQYKNSYEELEDLINEVFSSQDCISLM
ncbi:MAG TPA: polysialyltransferase family glycosyltransferase [Bacteroidia bacterium]|jgi:hypothetical protein|nr:polysialyltransferase family glycosyltransferase [Bacteroidia bacterium]